MSNGVTYNDLMIVDIEKNDVRMLIAIESGQHVLTEENMCMQHSQMASVARANTECRNVPGAYQLVALSATSYQATSINFGSNDMGATHQLAKLDSRV